MLDFSWSEFLVVIVVAVIAIGPKQLPDVLFKLGKLVRRMQYMRYAVTRQFDDFMDQSELRQLNDKPPRIIDPKDFKADTPRPELTDEAAFDEDVMEPLPPVDAEKKKVGNE